MGPTGEEINIKLEDPWNEAREAMWFLTIIPLIGRMKDEESIGVLECIVKKPEWFIVPEPTQEDDKYIYDIQMTPEFYKVLDKLKQ